MVNQDDEYVTDEYEAKLMSEEYKIWKKNTPFLYDMVIAHALEWPSLTAQWLPGREDVPDQECSRQRLILGTHTSENEPNSLLVTEVLMPKEDGELDLRQLNLGEQVDLGAVQSASERIQTVKEIQHDGEVNRARYMPQKPSVIATKTVSALVYVFFSDRHPAKPPPDERNCRPDLKLTGHETEGYGLAWSPFKEGYLLSGSDDQMICLWDINGETGPGKELHALNTFAEHKGVVEDIAWHSKYDYLFGSCGDDKNVMLWDLRQQKSLHQSIQAHPAEVNSLAFCPSSEWILATASADKTIGLHDVRNFSQRLHTLEGHSDEVFQVGWSGTNETILASCGADRRVIIWDLSRIGAEQSSEDHSDGPPELLFIHGGHTAKVSDFSWSPNDEWVVASVAEDNILQIWQMANYIYDDSYYKENAGCDA
ncbi:unnamed protein product [Ostreobium quekettii]|uniref:Histone-binding protein RBBP4-like N-terminal domain-containing protein n=1 Tax=Ostreobium quekettii TaxID=121088 RepID=A0A8S1J0L0_9CHLO|nr:unnamed protein product [Ostreobium quekettii]|eukprot:evm.model.scf_197EXC.10 EVM.evm.TU.scf_197EXC.10   scf_197EXC:78333-86985(+)